VPTRRAWQAVQVTESARRPEGRRETSSDRGLNFLALATSSSIFEIHQPAVNPSRGLLTGRAVRQSRLTLGGVPTGVVCAAPRRLWPRERGRPKSAHEAVAESATASRPWSARPPGRVRGVLVGFTADGRGEGRRRMGAERLDRVAGRPSSGKRTCGGCVFCRRHGRDGAVGGLGAAADAAIHAACSFPGPSTVFCPALGDTLPLFPPPHGTLPRAPSTPTPPLQRRGLAV